MNQILKVRKWHYLNLGMCGILKISMKVTNG